ncbi:MAG: hypothetical protein R2771_14005 [Saprospiraceae bacterium]
MAYPDLFDTIEVEDVFKPEFATLLDNMKMKGLDLYTMIEEGNFAANDGKVLPKRMFKLMVM